MTKVKKKKKKAKRRIRTGPSQKKVKVITVEPYTSLRKLHPTERTIEMIVARIHDEEWYLYESYDSPIRDTESKGARAEIESIEEEIESCYVLITGMLRNDKRLALHFNKKELYTKLKRDVEVGPLQDVDELLL